MYNNRVSIIIRTLENRLVFLDRAIFSIFCNTYPDKEVIIVYQGINSDYFAQLNRIFSDLYTEMDIKFIQNPTVNDERAKNLNLGIKNSSGRYLSFLDDDDIFYPNHLSTLVELLNSTKRAWAYSQVCVDVEDSGYIIRKDYPFRRDHFSFKKLWIDNFIPIHTFMIDTCKIKDKSLFWADEDLTRLEDYNILLKLAFYYEPACSNQVTTSYIIRTDSTNSNSGLIGHLNMNSNINDSEWDRAREKIALLKEELSGHHYWLREILGDLNYSWDLNQDEQMKAIYNSNGWQLLLKYYKIRDRLFPPGSRRRYYLKRIINSILKIL